MGRRSKKVDFDSLYKVEMSFIASCNARKMYAELPSKAVEWYIDLCNRSERPKSSSIASMNRNYLEAKYSDWSNKQSKTKVTVFRIPDTKNESEEDKAVKLLLRLGYTISKT